ncbi:MAG: hypothetical protein AAF485_10460 [Chloroflexota bacterium]
MLNISLSTHQSFLIRCWQEQPAIDTEPPVWRYTVKLINGTDKPLEFSSLPKALKFLADHLETHPPEVNNP